MFMKNNICTLKTPFKSYKTDKNKPSIRQNGTLLNILDRLVQPFYSDSATYTAHTDRDYNFKYIDHLKKKNF